MSHTYLVCRIVHSDRDGTVNETEPHYVTVVELEDRLPTQAAISKGLSEAALPLMRAVEHQGWPPPKSVLRFDTQE